MRVKAAVYKYILLLYFGSNNELCCWYCVVMIFTIPTSQSLNVVNVDDVIVLPDNSYMTIIFTHFHHTRVPIWSWKTGDRTQISGSSEPDHKNYPVRWISFIKYFWLTVSLIWVFGSLEPHFKSNVWTLWYHQALKFQVVNVVCSPLMANQYNTISVFPHL